MPLKFTLSFFAVAVLLLNLACSAAKAHALPVTLAEETQKVVRDMKGTEDQVFLTLQTNLTNVQALSKRLREEPDNPQLRKDIITVLEEATKSFNDLSNNKDDFRQELQKKLERLKDLQGRADQAVRDLQQRRAKFSQEDTSGSTDPIVISARRQAFQQAQRYVDDQINIWNQFIQTHTSIQTELGTINQRIEAFLSMIDATAVVYSEALNLVKLQQDVRWALSLFTQDLPQMTTLTESMRSSWGTIDSLVQALVNLSEPASAEANNQS